MIRVVAIVCALASSAYAEGTYIKAPAGWTRADDQARSLSKKANEVTHFGGVKSLATTEVFVAPTGYAAGLYVTAVVAKIANGRDGAIRAEVDSFLAGPARAGLTSSKIAVQQSGSVVDPKTKQIDATVAWTDADSGISSTSRLLVVADAEAIVAVSAECSHGEQPGAHVQDCLGALATLDPGVPIDKRVDVALAVYAPGTPAEAPGEATGTPSSQGTLTGRPSTMSDGTRTPLPPMIVPGATKRTTDRRPVYVGLGIVVLAAVFWWNRRRTETRIARLEKESNDDDR